MPDLNEYDVVRVAKLRLSRESRAIMGSPDILREPQIGDIGTILISYGGQSNAFIVECCDDMGRSFWVADFLTEELELVNKYIG